MELPTTKEEVWEHFEHPHELTEREKKYVRYQVFTDHEYIFCEDKQERYHGWCSHCGREVDLLMEGGRNKHNSIATCPHCGTFATIKHVWRGIGYVNDEALVYLYDKSAKDRSCITVRAVSVTRPWGEAQSCNVKPSKMKICVLVDSWYVFVPGKGGAQVKPIENGRIYVRRYYDGMSKTGAYEMAARPHPRTGHYKYNPFGTTYYCEETGNWGNETHCIFDIDETGAERAVAGTVFEYGFQEYRPYDKNDSAYIRFFDWQQRHPSVEMLVKMGLGSMVGTRLSKSGGFGTGIHWNGKTVQKILGRNPTRAEKRYMLEHGDDIGVGTIDFWARSPQSVSLQEAYHMHIYGTSRMMTLYKYAKLDKVMRYLDKQQNTMDMYLDYLVECEMLEMNMREKSTLYPKNLKHEHEANKEKIRYHKNELLERLYEKRLPKLRRRYEMEEDGLCVVMPEKLEDLISEGNEMHNCVGGYMERVGKGQTDVMFIRKCEEPEKSFVTMEVKDGKIVQARSKRNGPLDIATAAFVEKFRMEKLENENKEIRVRVTA